MENIFITPNEITEILKKRYKEKNECENIDNISKEDINNFIVEAQVDKFSELFNNVFEEELLPFEKGEDFEDGPMNEICLKIIESIKESFEKVDKEKLLKILFKLISKLVFKEE